MRARRLITENKRDRLSLSSVAKAAGASMFHFCTLFRQTTGLKFSDYVARSRIEDARSLLCDPRRRMCEVASEAGFQSMTAFNRAFRRVVGQSPTEYRTGLAANGATLDRCPSVHGICRGKSSGPAYHSRPNGGASQIRPTPRPPMASKIASTARG